MMRYWLLALVIFTPPMVNAECDIDLARMKPAFSGEALARRNTLFSELCRKAGGRLYDATDPTMAGRLAPPAGIFLPPVGRDYYPKKARRAGIVGSPTVMYLVELDGSIHNVTLLESSGDQTLDDAAIAVFYDMRYSMPAKLDGVPVQVIAYAKVPFNIK